MAEQGAFNSKDAGSSPVGGTLRMLMRDNIIPILWIILLIVAYTLMITNEIMHL